MIFNLARSTETNVAQTRWELRINGTDQKCWNFNSVRESRPTDARSPRFGINKTEIFPTRLKSSQTTRKSRHELLALVIGNFLRSLFSVLRIHIR